MLKVWFGAASFELGSIAILLSSVASPAVLATYFGIHAIGSALLSLALLPLVPARYAEPRGWLFAFLFAFNFFVPIAGLVCVLGGLAFSLSLGFGLRAYIDREVRARPAFWTVHVQPGRGAAVPEADKADGKGKKAKTKKDE